jgi:hypothetical protein
LYGEYHQHILVLLKPLRAPVKNTDKGAEGLVANQCENLQITGGEFGRFNEIVTLLGSKASGAHFKHEPLCRILKPQKTIHLPVITTHSRNPTLPFHPTDWLASINMLLFDPKLYDQKSLKFRKQHTQFVGSRSRYLKKTWIRTARVFYGSKKFSPEDS